MTNTKTKSKKKPTGRHGPCGRQRALPSPNAISFTIRDFQALGGPGKTSLYEENKRRKEKGEKPLLFKDAFNRRMVVGDVGRELLGITDEVS
jgi:hypothetical protein